LDHRKDDLEKLEQQTLMPGFWDDADTAKRVQKELGQLQDVIKGWEDGWAELEETDLLLEMATEEKDSEIEQEVADALPRIEEQIEVAELECMFSGEHDASNVIISIHAGAGGTEAQDWVGILLRMYLRWAEAKGFKADILDIGRGSDGGINLGPEAGSYADHLLIGPARMSRNYNFSFRHHSHDPLFFPALIKGHLFHVRCDHAFPCQLQLCLHAVFSSLLLSRPGRQKKIRVMIKS